MTQDEATEFFAEWLGGRHHIPSDVKPWGQGWRISVPTSRLSTFDFDALTRLVFLAHDRCVRVELDQSGPRRIGVIAHQRRKRDGSSMERHPTVEQALAVWRRSWPDADRREQPSAGASR